MGHSVELTATDGQRLAAYLAEPSGKPRGGIVVIQEIFGVTGHIRAVTDQYAAAGYLAIAPALFDRVEANVDVPYSDVQRALGYLNKMDAGTVMLDVAAAVERVSGAGKVGTVGYCWGGTLSYRAATSLAVAAAVAYYGGGIDQYLDTKPGVPVMFHYGEKDTHIPLATVEKIKAAYPQGIYHLYPAEHGFNCTDRASFHPESAKLAFERSLEFFRKHVG
jgi:carboxymethylenebutenolidase